MQDRIMNHGLTINQINDLKFRQQQNEVTKMKGNRVEKIKDEHFKKEYSDYSLIVEEKHIFHLATEPRLFSPNTGEKQSVSKVMKLTEQNFKIMNDTNAFAGLTVEILHDPRIKDAPKKEETKKPGKPGRKPAAKTESAE